MGLDISAYSKLKKLDVVFDADGEPIDPTTREPLDWTTYVLVRVNGNFPERAEGVENGAVYAYEDSHGFRAGSYGGYNEWRNALAQLAGYGQVETERVPGYAPSRVMRYDAAAWRADGGPFHELINFSDCEGVIGPVVAKKLLQDFIDFEERARAFVFNDDPGASTWFWEKYCRWKRAFELAADGGCVSFH